MKIVIPVAGLGSRLKPHTHTTPKPLMDVAGKPIIERVIEDCLKLKPDELIFIVGYKKESVIDFISSRFPEINCKFVEQEVRDGDGSAIRLGLDGIDKEDELYVIFGADTLIDFDIVENLKRFSGSDSIVFGMEVDEPSNYGIMNLKENNEIYEVEEKPDVPKSNLAIIGAYYFRSLQNVKRLLNKFYEDNKTIKGEFKLVQVIEEYIKDSKLSIKGVKVNKWFDCGRVEVLLDANKYFLEKYSSNQVRIVNNNIIVPPSYIHESAKISNSIIGPFASIGKDCLILNSIVENSIVNIDSKLEHVNLKNSFVGKHTVVHGKESRINIGDNSEIYLN